MSRDHSQRRETYANPNAIMPQIPNLTRRGSLMFHRNIIGKIERTKSVAAAIAEGRSSALDTLIRTVKEAYTLG